MAINITTTNIAPGLNINIITIGSSFRLTPGYELDSPANFDLTGKHGVRYPSATTDATRYAGRTDYPDEPGTDKPGGYSPEEHPS